MSTLVTLDKRTADTKFPSGVFTNKSVGELLKLIKNNILNTQPVYQRNAERWSAAKKQSLIHTVMSSNLGVPAVWIQKKTEIDGRISLHLIDGQQRLTTLLAFNENKFKSKLDNKRFNELSDEEQSQFNDYQISCWAQDFTDEEASEQFILLQQGTNMTGDEKRHALIGKAMPAMVAVKSLAQKLNYGQSVGQRNDNYKCDGEILKMLLIAYTSIVHDYNENITLDEKSLDTFANDDYLSNGGNLDNIDFSTAITIAEEGMKWVINICGDNKHWSSTKRLAIYYMWLKYKNELPANAICSRKVNNLNNQVAAVKWVAGDSSSISYVNKLNNQTKGAMNSLIHAILPITMIYKDYINDPNMT